MYTVAKKRKQLKSRMNALACIIDSDSLACMYSFPATEVVGQFTHIQVIILVFYRPRLYLYMLGIVQLLIREL